MEPKKHLTKTKSLSSRNGKTTSETLNFRKVARQVMLANMFTRRRPNEQSQMSARKAAAAEPRFAGSKTLRKHRALPEKPPLIRRGTPELFPMSDEMKQTVISLGKLNLFSDLDEERESNTAAGARLEKSRTSSKFRDKTRQRIIHPQRFIRNARSAVSKSETTVENGVRCEENIEEEDSGCEESQKDKEEYFNNKVSNGILSRTKLGCNVLSRPQSTPSYCNAKAANCQYFSLARRPFLLTRCSDLGPVSTKRAVRRTRSQGTWPLQDNVFPDTRISSTRQQYLSKMGKNTTKAWVAGSETSRSMEESDKLNKHEMMQTRRWKSVESLTREIEEKCLSWLENRYGVVR